MYYVYILKSINYPDQIYIGFTTELAKRLATHNTGDSAYTSKYLPWEIITYTVFKEKQRAIDFEKYLKTASGRSLLKRRFL